MTKNIMPATLLCDFYKVSHKDQYPKGTEVIYSTWTPRSTLMKGVDKVVNFGLQAFIKKYLIEYFSEHFFGRDKQEVLDEYVRYIHFTLGIPKEKIDSSHIAFLHDLGYLPIKIKALPEGMLSPLKVPAITIENTVPECFWITNYLETIMSSEIWLPSTSATKAHEMRKVLDEYAIKTTGSTAGVDFQSHDFSMRGMAGLEAAMLSGAGHLLSFTGTDSIPAIGFMEAYYNANIENEIVGSSIPATEHSTQSANAKGQKDEYETFKRLITDVYPEGFISIVSDTYDFWDNVTRVVPLLKEEIMKRNGKVVIRPDSGVPEDVLCGIPKQEYDNILFYSSDKLKQGMYDEILDDFGELDDDIKEELKDIVFDLWQDTKNSDRDEGETLFHYTVQTIDNKLYNIESEILSFEYYETTVMDKVSHTVLEEVISTESSPESKGLVEVLWDIFGGTINEQGYKVLDPHIGAIYGDSITLERTKEICKRLEEKGFASTNIVLGTGSFFYQFTTRDVFGYAMKATSCTINGEEIQIFKEPKGDSKKKSQKGRVAVFEESGEIKYVDELTTETYAANYEDKDLLELVYLDGELIRNDSLKNIRQRLNNN